MKEINVQELKAMLDAKEDFTLIDVREEYEFDAANIGGHLIPMGDVMERVAEVPKDKKVVVHCRSGKRSATVIGALEQNFGFTNLINLKGGIMAWAAEIDPSLNPS
jgi:adenylyltransferase/sulfurtransferase